MQWVAQQKIKTESLINASRCIRNETFAVDQNLCLKPKSKSCG